MGKKEPALDIVQREGSGEETLWTKAPQWKRVWFFGETEETSMAGVW